MERLGGGGHMNIAGAQLKDTDLEGAKGEAERSTDTDDERRSDLI